MTECVLRVEEESAVMKGGAREKNFRDSFTLRISGAGDRASNPFPDVFLIVRESRAGWESMGLGCSQWGECAHLHGVTHVSEVQHIYLNMFRI